METRTIKNIYSETWQSEFAVCQDLFGEESQPWYLMPTKNTTFDTLQKYGFQERAFGKWTLSFDSPSNYGLTWDKCVDVDEINGVMALIFESDSLLSVHPAFGGSGMALDSYCMDLGTYGDWGDYVKLSCVTCGKYWYHNQRSIPSGTKYDTPCPYCKAMIMRKKV